MKRSTIPTKALSPQVKQAAMQIVNERLQKMVQASVITSRSSIASSLGYSYHGKRNLYEALGYPQIGKISYTDFWGNYKRQDIAGRVVDAPVDGCWQTKPVIKPVDEEKEEFEKALSKLNLEKGVFSILTRLDRITRIGQYSVLFMGFKDANNAEELKQPVAGKAELLYLQPYSEGNATIHNYEENVNDPRYGLPLIYQLTYQEPGNQNSNKTLYVHYTRVLHVTENLLESNLYGMPALERIWNRLLNLELIVGGSAEMFWQGAFPGYAFEADPEGDITASASDLEDEIDLFVHDFKRYMKLQGITVNKLSSDVADPKSHVDVQITMISIATGIPKRILMGSERGELASGQDEAHWNDQLEYRRTDHIDSDIIRPFIDKMIETGNLPDPGAEGYTVVWNDLNAPGLKEKSAIAKTYSDALKNYTSDPNMELVVPFESFLTEFMMLDPDRVKRIVQAQEEQGGLLLGDDGEGDDESEGLEEVEPTEEEEQE